ncbi:hypothetical protein [Haloarchaeobius sp. HRN-SO-5]|uniref:hypothetical protein n=1 Tax=Haloarchaeobius sp. HRN-SO-5 TaxID=3446118 RepID=UPI003EBFFE37
MVQSLPQEVRGDGWELVDRTEETVFRLATVEVRGDTALYEDVPLRRAVREATDGALDQPWRFVFTTRLSFRPPLSPGVGTASVFPTVVSSARRKFAADLRERGFRNVERGRSDGMRTNGGARARLTQYDATYDLREAGVDGEVAVEGWLSVWVDGGTFRLAGGAYPVSGLDAVVPGVVADPGTYRNELLAILRSLA